MPLSLIHGPPNSGRAGLLRAGFSTALDRDPVLVVPNLDDVFAWERELASSGAAVGGAAMTFGALFTTIATAAGAPPGAVLTAAQRQRCVDAAVAAAAPRLGPLRRSASRPGFSRAFAWLLDELQPGGVEPEALAAIAGTLEGSAYLSDLATLYAAYAEVRARTGRLDAHDVARGAIELLRHEPAAWSGRPVFLYGFDDLTALQFDLIAALSARTEVTVALTFEADGAAFAARERLLSRLRKWIGAEAEVATDADPANTESPALFAIARAFGVPGSASIPAPSEGELVILRSAGVRGEADAIAAEVSRLVAAGTDPAAIAIAVRDPARRGPELAAALERNGIAVALEADAGVATTAVGGALLALLEAEWGTRRASDVLRYLRGPSGFSAERVDWFERALRRGRIEDADGAWRRWRGEEGEDPRDLGRLRTAAAESPAALAAAAGALASRMAARPLRTGADAPRPGPGEGFELRAAGAAAGALAELAALDELAPSPAELIATVAGLEFLAWSGPVEGRVRIADPYRLRAARFDHVLVASLQDGEFPRRDRGGDPFLAETQREQLGLDPRRDREAEERYLFATCLSLPRRRLFLSYRDSDENGAAESRSPYLDDIRALLAPAADGTAPDPVETALTRVRDLATVVSPLAEAPSPDELARALAAHGPSADWDALLTDVGVGGELPERLLDRLAAAKRGERASRTPGPLADPAVLSALGAVAAYGGTTLEEFDSCSYRWFVGHELDPQPLDPLPEPIVQGGLIHSVLHRLYEEPPGPAALPRPDDLSAWLERGRQLLSNALAEREIGSHPSERAMARRVQRLLERFLAEEAARDPGGFEPWLLEAAFGEAEDAERGILDLGEWGLHGAIDRVDRDAAGRAVVLDYKLAASVTPLADFEGKAKLQLPLYLTAVEHLWGAKPVAGLYHPLRGTSRRRPRGVVADEASGDLADYEPFGNDVVSAEGLEEVLAESHRRADEIVTRIRAGDIRRDPGPRAPLRGHDVCPAFCTYAPICRRDRAPRYVEMEAAEER